MGRVLPWLVAGAFELVHQVLVRDLLPCHILLVALTSRLLARIARHDPT